MSEYEAQTEVIAQVQFDKLFADLTPLPTLPLPPMLLEALGYHHNDKPASAHRYVSFYWMSNKPRIDDGNLSTDGDAEVYLLFVRYGAVGKQLINYQLGSSDFPNRHRLLLDRAENKWYVGNTPKVGSIVQLQYFVGMTKAEYERQRAETEAMFADIEFNLEEELTKAFEVIASRPFDAVAFQAMRERQARLYYAVRDWLREHYPVSKLEEAGIYATRPSLRQTTVENEADGSEEGPKQA